MPAALGICGFALTTVGALVLAWGDLTGGPLTYDSVEWRRRRLLAVFGFPLVAIGSALGAVGIAVG